jgi:hypothetical protein
MFPKRERENATRDSQRQRCEKDSCKRIIGTGQFANEQGITFATKKKTGIWFFPNAVP